MSLTASVYCGRFSRLRQSSSVSFHDLSGIVAATFEAAQLLLVREVHPELDHDHALFGQRVLEVVDLVVGPTPLHLGGQPLHPLDQHPSVPAAVEDRHAAPAGQRRPEAPQEMVAQLVVRGGGEGGDVDVTWIERLDQALDGATLAGGVPPLEDDADRRTQFPSAQLATDDQPQMQQPELGRVQALFLVVFREASGEIHILQPGDVFGHGAY